MNSDSKITTNTQEMYKTIPAIYSLYREGNVEEAIRKLQDNEQELNGLQEYYVLLGALYWSANMQKDLYQLFLSPDKNIDLIGLWYNIYLLSMKSNQPTQAVDFAIWVVMNFNNLDYGDSYKTIESIANHLQSSNLSQQAIALLEAFLRRGCGDGFVHNMLINLLNETSQDKLVPDAIQRAINSDAAFPNGYLFLAVKSIENRDQVTGRYWLSKGIDHVRSHIEDHNGTQLYCRYGRTTKDEPDWFVAIERLYWHYGKQLQDKGNHEDALEVWEEGYKLGSRDVQTLEALSREYYKSDLVDRAIEISEEAYAELNFNDIGINENREIYTRLFSNMAHFYIRTGLFHRAKEITEKALRLGLETITIHHSLSIIYKAHDQNDKIIETSANILRIYNSSNMIVETKAEEDVVGATCYDLVNLLRQNNDFEGAIIVLENLKNADWFDSYFYILLSSMYLRFENGEPHYTEFSKLRGTRANIEDAVSVLTEAIERHHTSSFIFSRLMALHIEFTQDLKELLRLFTIAKELDQLDSGSYCSASQMYRLQGETQEAIQVAEEAIKGGKVSPNLLSNLLIYYQDTGKVSRAIELGESFINQIELHNSSFYLNFGSQYREVGDINKAIRIWKIGVERGVAGAKVYLALANQLSELHLHDNIVQVLAFIDQGLCCSDIEQVEKADFYNLLISFYQTSADERVLEHRLKNINEFLETLGNMGDTLQKWQDNVYLSPILDDIYIYMVLANEVLGKANDSYQFVIAKAQIIYRRADLIHKGELQGALSQILPLLSLYVPEFVGMGLNSRIIADAAFKDISNLLDNARQLAPTPIDELNVLKEHGDIAHSLGLFHAACDIFIIGAEVSQRYNQIGRLTDFRLRLSRSYLHIEDFYKAELNLKQMIKLAESYNLFTYAIIGYQELGRIFYHREQYKEALNNFSKSCALLEQMSRLIDSEDYRMELIDFYIDSFRYAIETCIILGKGNEAYCFLERSKSQSLLVNLNKTTDYNLARFDKTIAEEPSFEVIDTIRFLEDTLDDKGALVEYFVHINGNITAFIFVNLNGKWNVCVSNCDTNISDLKAYITVPNIRFSSIYDIIRYFIPVPNKKINMYGQLAPIMAKEGIALRFLSTLYKALWERVDSFIQGNVDIVYIVPHKLLHNLPFNALYDEAKQQFILHKPYDIVYIPSASCLGPLYFTAKDTCIRDINQVSGIEIIPDKKQSGKNVPLALCYSTLKMAHPSRLGRFKKRYCVISYDTHLKKLRLYGGSPDSTFEPDEQKSIKDIFRSIEPSDLTVLACHGIFNSTNPLNSYLDFNVFDLETRHIQQKPEMRLTVYPINPDILSGYELGSFLRPGSIVVLLACVTGASIVSEGDELIGLSRGFFYSKAGTVISTLWDTMSDDNSLFLMKFTEYLERDTPSVHAFNRTIQDMASIKEKSHPKHWGGYIFVGRHW